MKRDWCVCRDKFSLKDGSRGRFAVLTITPRPTTKMTAKTTYHNNNFGSGWNVSFLFAEIRFLWLPHDMHERDRGGLSQVFSQGTNIVNSGPSGTGVA
jgi:hypothetical protein